MSAPSKPANRGLSVVITFVLALGFCSLVEWVTGIPWPTLVAGVALYIAVVAQVNGIADRGEL